MHRFRITFSLYQSFALFIQNIKNISICIVLLIKAPKQCLPCPYGKPSQDCAGNNVCLFCLSDGICRPSLELSVSGFASEEAEF